MDGFVKETGYTMEPICKGHFKKQYTACFIVAVSDIDAAVEICQNITKFSKESIVVIHNNATSSFTNLNLEIKIREIIPGECHRIFICHERLSMNNPHEPSPNSLFEIYKTCICMARKLGEWKYAVFTQSNERFVRKGVDEYLANCPYEGGISEIPDLVSGVFKGHKMIKDVKIHGEDFGIYKTLMPEYEQFYYGQTEGSFVSRNIADVLCSRAPIDYKSVSHIQAPHEKIIPSIMHNFSENIGNSITYINWKNNLAVTKEIIEDIINNKMDGIYCVKRVNMDSIEIRNYINNLE